MLRRRRFTSSRSDLAARAAAHLESVFFAMLAFGSRKETNKSDAGRHAQGLFRGEKDG